MSRGLELRAYYQPVFASLDRKMAHLGEKLKIVCDGAPIHSPRSCALASDTPQATMHVLISDCAETYHAREMKTSYVGPTSPPTNWTLSAIRRATVCTFFLCLHLRERMTHYTSMLARSIEVLQLHTWAGVHTMTSPISRSRKSALVSPVKPTISFPPLTPLNFLRHSETHWLTIS